MAEYTNPNPDWYVIHTYSGYENKVKDSLEKSVVNNGMSDLITEVTIPVEEVVEIKNGKRRTVQRKLLPGYVFVKMVMTNETWFQVRNTRGCTGFVGAGNKPFPLAETEFANVLKMTEAPKTDIAIGDNVRLTSGLFENFTGKVIEIDTVNSRLKVSVPMLKRETEVDVAYDEVVLAPEGEE